MHAVPQSVRRRQHGSGHFSTIFVVVSIVCVVGAVWWLGHEPSVDHAAELTVHCAAGLLPAVEPAAKEYEEEFGVRVLVDAASSGALLNKLRIRSSGDVYIPADRMFVALAQEAKLIRETLPLAKFRLCLAVRPGNPKGLTSIGSLLRSDVLFSIPNERAAAGAKAKERLGDALWERVKAGAKVMKPTVTEVAQDLQTESVDAALIWDSTAAQFDLEVVRLPELEEAWGWIDATILESSEAPSEALRFARYLAAPERGQKHFENSHYVGADGDPWELRPRVILFSGGVNRPAIAETLRAFEEREGCMVETHYNGCGALLAQMDAGADPDLYFACDVSFSDQVVNRFDPFRNISRMAMVILVPKGNPAQVQKLDDLARPELKIGRADEVLSALGALTAKLLQDAGIYEKVKANTAATSPTAAELVAQVRLGSHLDAAVVYMANAHASVQEGTAEVIPIDHPLATAIQPIAASKSTRFPALTGRLMRAIANSRERFEQVGFEWLADTPQQ